MSRLLLLIMIVVVALGWWLLNRHGRFDGLTDQVASAQTKAGPGGSIKPEVAIQDGKTIDFSTGKPVMKDSADDKAVIDAAVKEMDEASKGVTFGPTTAAGEERKTADPAESPPKP